MPELGKRDPRRIGPYTITEVLGEGGMGRVYLGKADSQLAAVKLIRSANMDDEALKRFTREVDAAKRVFSSRIASVVQSGVSGTMPWYASEYVPGLTLFQDVKRKPYDEQKLKWLAYELYRALEAIYVAGVVHRDLKPSNIIVTDKHVKVIDFGIAFVADLPNLTRTGFTIGTPGYMAPEQLEGRRPSRSWDIFAYGCVLAFAATGQQAFKNANEVFTKTPDLSSVARPLRRLIQGCLAKDRHDRATLTDIYRMLRDMGALAHSSNFIPKKKAGGQAVGVAKVVTKPAPKPAPKRPANKEAPRSSLRSLYKRLSRHFVTYPRPIEISRPALYIIMAIIAVIALRIVGIL